MAIATLENYANAPKQTVLWSAKTLGAGSFPAGFYIDGLLTGGFPTGGSNNPGNSANGIVPTATTAGAPAIQAFSGTGYITRVEIANVGTAGVPACLYDRLFACGSYVAGSGTTTLSSQPSYSSRVPGGSDYSGLRIFVGCVNNVNTPTGVTVTYTNESGSTGHSTGAVSWGTNLSTAGTSALLMLPLQSGDCGVQKIESVTPSGGSTVGAISILVMRPLGLYYVAAGNTGPGPLSSYGLDSSKMPQVFSDSCLCFIARDDTGAISVDLEIASG